MSLQEALERDRLQQAEAARAQERQRKLYEEAGISGCRIGPRPVELPPEHQALIDEFVKLCPARVWQKLPEKADRRSASCNWDRGTLVAECRGGEFWGQVKLPDDETIHIIQYKLMLRLELEDPRPQVKQRRFFRKAQEQEEEQVRQAALERVLQEARQKIDLWRRSQYGSGESVCLTYFPSSDCDETYKVFLFRDGTMYDLGQFESLRREHAPYRKSRDILEQWLLGYLRQWT